VGTGTGASCTEAALTACLPGGGSFDGTVTFNCGGAATIIVTSTKAIRADTTIDGGSLITISGGNSVGVFSVDAGVNFTVQNLTIANGNSAVYGGGIANNGTVTVTNSTFSDNSAGYAGGGIANGGTLTVTNSTFSGNSVTGSSGGGGGAIANDGTVTVTNSTFSDNSAISSGGGIANNGTLTVTNSTFSGNSASGVGYGGGGGIGNNGTVTVTSSTFSGNSASGLGGGAIANDGTVTVTNSSFSGNSTSGLGGGAVANDGTVTVTNSTFSGNSAAGSGGGAIFNFSRTVAVTVTNTIVANSTSGGNCAGGVTDGGYNIDDGTTCGFTGTGCTATTGTSFCNTNPVLDPTGLQNNGGPTETIALEAGSAAVNAGNESVCAVPPVNNLDQRGYVRPGVGSTNCSIGAYEYNSPGPPCVGDCNGDGTVTLDDILTMVNIALGNTLVTTCEAGDANRDGEITVDEILTAVNNALNGC
jgi:hypothetical protein